MTTPNLFMPRGFEPYNTPFGNLKRRKVTLNYDDSAWTATQAPIVEALFLGDPLMMSHVDRRYTKALMGTGHPIKGILLALFDQDGVPQHFRPAGICTRPWTAIICDDPDQEWVLLESGDVIRPDDHSWSNADLLDRGGCQVTGRSGVMIDSRTVSGGGIGQYGEDQITLIEKLDSPANALAGRYTRWVVKLNNYQRMGDRHLPNHCDGDPGDIEGSHEDQCAQ